VHAADRRFLAARLIAAMARARPAALVAIAALLASGAARAETAEPEGPPIAFGITWLVTQLVPSPSIAGARGETMFGARWQVTPLLYSFGVHRGTPPLRAFMVEPLVRHSGSIEAYVSPEYLAREGGAEDRWLMRPGIRAYFPLVERGDSLSCSLGTSYALLRGHSGVAYEAGLYTLFGVFGVQMTYAPAREPADWIATLSFRYF
jgi:hypothetical protein